MLNAVKKFAYFQDPLLLLLNCDESWQSCCWPCLLQIFFKSSAVVAVQQFGMTISDQVLEEHSHRICLLLEAASPHPPLKQGLISCVCYGGEGAIKVYIHTRFLSTQIGRGINL